MSTAVSTMLRGCRALMSSAAAGGKKPAVAAAKPKAAKKKGPVDPNNLRGIMRPVPVSDALRKFGGAAHISRSGVLKIIWDYIKANNLQAGQLERRLQLHLRPRLSAVLPHRDQRSQTTVVPVAEEAVPKTRWASRRAPARKTDTQQDEEGEGQQAAVVKAVALAPVSSDEGADDAAAMEAAMDLQTEEQNGLVEEQNKEEERETGDDMETVVPTQEMEEDAMDLQNEEQSKLVEDQCQEDAAETAPVSSDEQDDGTEEIEDEVMDPQNGEQKELLVEEQSQEEERETGRTTGTAPSTTPPTSA